MDNIYSGSNWIDTVAWYRDSSDLQGPHPVGCKLENELGIHDMSGNVEEWCADRFSTYSSAAQTNPTGSSTGYWRVTRGGNCHSLYFHMHVSVRDTYDPDERSDIIGFRLACSSH
jgi:formylglycine-generating enzyme required for sulfatase activity